MFTRLDYSSALEYNIIRRYTNIVYYYYYINRAAIVSIVIDHLDNHGWKHCIVEQLFLYAKCKSSDLNTAEFSDIIQLDHLGNYE